MRTIAIVNQKGGCGKTTTAINLAAVYARRGVRTLLVDMDPQSHCSAGLGVPEGRIEFSIADALLSDLDRAFDPAGLVWEVSRCLDLAPATMRLAGLEAPGGGLHRLPDKDRRLERLIERLDDRYDCCLIDCPPTIGLLTFNALRAAREALIPVETGFFAMKGAARQWNTIQKTISRIGRPIACHLLPTMHKPDLKISREILASLRRDFAGQIVPVVIRDHDELRAAASFGQPVLEYAPGSDAHEDFQRLADWLDAHRSEPTMQIEVVAGSLMREPVARDFREGGGRGDEGTESRAAELASRVRDRSHRDPAAAVTAGTPEPGSHQAQPEPQNQTQPQTQPQPQPHTQVQSPVQVRTPAPASPLSAPRHPGPSPARPTVVAAPMPPAAVPDEPSTQADTPGRPLMEAIKGETAGSAAGVGSRHLLGVRLTSQGALFVQPADVGDRVSIAGNFNGWSSQTDPLRFNGQLGVFQGIIPLEPGQYQYRIVADGRWQADPYNPDRLVNEYGETNSILIVPGTSGQPQSQGES